MSQQQAAPGEQRVVSPGEEPCRLSGVTLWVDMMAGQTKLSGILEYILEITVKQCGLLR